MNKYMTCVPAVLASLVLFGFGLLPGLAQNCGGNRGTSDTKDTFNNKDGDTAGDPVSMTSGALQFNHTDLTVPGPVPIAVTRYYNSSTRYHGPLGNNNDLSLNRYVQYLPSLVGDTVTSPVYYETGKGYKVFIGTLTSYYNGTFSVDYSGTYREHYTISFSDAGYLIISDIHGNKDFMDKGGYIVKSLDKNGNELDYHRDAYENLTSVEDPVHGTYITFSVGSDGLIHSVTDSFGRTVSYSYDSDGNLTGIQYPATPQHPDGTGFGYTYDSNERLLTEVDGNGKTILSNTWGQIWGISANGDGTYTYYPEVFSDPPIPANSGWYNEVVSQVYNGSTTTFSYQQDGSASTPSEVTATNGNGYVTDYYNDGNGDITKKVVHTAGCHSGAPSTYETDYTYSTDGQYNKLTEVDPDGNRTSWTYDANANVTSETKSFASGATVNSSEGTQSLTATTYYTYEPRFNQVASVQDPNGNVTTYNYGTADTNPGGNLLSVTYPSTAAGTATESYTYNSLGQVLTDTAPDGTVTQNTYDDSTGYLTQTVKDYGTGKLNATTHFAYDEYGHVDQTTDPDGHTTTITTDAQDNVTEIDGASGEVEQKSYDVNGNLTTDQKQAPGGLWQRTDSVYNNDEQLVATRQYTDASDYLETDYTYDADGNRASVTDPLHHTTSTAYDERDMPYKTTDQLGNTTTLDFDGEGNTIRLTDELGHVTTYAFDGLNRLEQKTFPDGSYQTWTYDATGNITSLRTTGGHTVTQTFDARNRMLTQSYTAATGSSTITNVYDIMGRLSTTTEGGTSLSYSYDNLGRNTSFTDQAGLTSTYSYDLAGNRTSTTYPTSVTVQRAHDASNRVTTLEDGSNNVQATYSYDSLDRPTGMTLANSTSVAWNYDLLGRMTSVGNTLQTGNRNYSYGYDNASRRTSVTEPRGTVSFGYTNRNEVNAVTEPSGSPFADQSFTYDAGFNRSNWTSGTTSTGYTVNNLNQYTAVASATPSWNGDGGLASFNGNTYTYDGMMRLVEVDNSLGKYLFSYDPTGRRVKKVLESTSGTVLETFSYHYDGSEVAVEYTPTNTWTYYLGLGIDQPVMRVNGSTKQWYYADAQGSISAVADNSGNALEQYEYDPQGHVEVTNGSGTAETGTMIDNYIAFTGRNFDFETGNYFYRARYYSPDLGRFISRDPLSGAEFSQGTNLYAYCGNDPVNYSDPTGMDKKKQKELYDAAKKHFEDEGWPSWLAAEMASAGMWANDHHDALEDANAALMAAQMLDGAGELEALGEEGAEAADGAAAGLCFKEGTLVATPNGEKPIEAIKAGEEVYAYDFNRGKVVASHVREVYRNTTDQWEDLTLADGEAIHCTPKHRFWVESEHAWLEAFRLRHGMALLAETGLVETVKQISVRQLPAPEKTYNFNVEGEHDYFVGKAKILVHNSCSAPSSSDLTEGARSALGKGPDATPGQPLTDTQSAGLQKNLDAAVNSASKALQNPDAEASASRYNTSADRIQQISNTVSSGVGAARN